MLSKRMIETIGLRVRAMATCGETIFSWDKTTSRLILPRTPYMYWNWCLGLLGGYWLCVLHAIELYLRFFITSNDITDEAVLTQREAGDKLKQFALTVIEIAQSLLVLVICMLASHIQKHRDKIMYLMNQMFEYHDQIEQMLAVRQIELDANHKKVIRNGEGLILFISVSSYFFPCVCMACFLHPLEPNHALMKEWLDFELTLENLKPIHILFVPVFWAALHAAGNTVITVGFMVTCYNQMASVLLEDTTPVRGHPDESGQRMAKRFWILETTAFGDLADEEVIHLYRIQQVFLAMVNEIMAAFPVSVHHVATLATASSMIYFAIKFHTVLKETGWVGYAIVLGAVVLAVVIEFVEARQIGNLVDVSVQFRESGEKFIVRKTLFYRFLKSCSPMHVQEAYPYYNVDRGTFLEFGNQVVDYTITLLLW